MLSDYDVEVLIGGLAVLAVYGYAAFWAFNIRRGLTVKLYRNQTLGIGLVAIGLAYFSFVFDKLLSFVVTSSLGTDIGFAILPLVLFYFTDQSLRAARESDPLERDQFHWSKLRIVLWIAILISLIITGNLVSPTSGLVFAIVDVATAFIALGIPLASSAILLPLAWTRSSDITFRRHLKWFGLSAISIGLCFVWALLTPPGGVPGVFVISNAFVSLSGEFVFLLLSAYFLYRSARAVVPLYSFKEKIET